MELKRKCAEEIRAWYRNQNQQALLVRGARQVGKTYLIRSALSSLGCDVLELNLIETPAAVGVLQRADSVDDLILGLSALSDHRCIKGETVIFIDEVQKYAEMVTKIKFFVEEGSFRYVLSGSLLGIELTGLSSAPVGFLHILDMFPLDFEEFLQLAHPGEDILHHIWDCFQNRSAVEEAVNNKFLDLFTRYLMVGGMPQAVCTFAETNNLADVASVHRDILRLYHLDFTQYEEVQKKLMISNIYELIPAELLKQNRRFIITDLRKGLRFEKTESSFLWLQNAGVTIPAFNATEPKLPLKLSEKHSLFKLYLSDVGMLTSIYGIQTKRLLLERDKHLNAGGIYENAVAQELHAKGHALYYYNSNRMGELDFVIEHHGKILPLEVKSGKDYTIHSAIDYSLSNPAYDIEEAVVFANCNVSRKGNITYLPVYMVMFFEKEQTALFPEAVVF